ncbi:MAG: hypothetical protein AB2693_33650, partial [Candidatus Thiodiazotropha sp.]
NSTCSIKIVLFLVPQPFLYKTCIIFAYFIMGNGLSKYFPIDIFNFIKQQQKIQDSRTVFGTPKIIFHFLKAVKLPTVVFRSGVTSNAERCKKYRAKKIAEDPNFLDTERQRHRQYRLSRTPEQIQRDRETAKHRMKRLRLKKAESAGTTSDDVNCSKTKHIMTRKQTEQQRVKWRDAKRKYRYCLYPGKLCWINLFILFIIL